MYKKKIYTIPLFKNYQLPYHRCLPPQQQTTMDAPPATSPLPVLYVELANSVAQHKHMGSDTQLSGPMIHCLCYITHSYSPAGHLGPAHPLTIQPILLSLFLVFEKQQHLLRYMPKGEGEASAAPASSVVKMMAKILACMVVGMLVKVLECAYVCVYLCGFVG